MKKIAIMAMLLCAGHAGAQQSNPLLGSWKLDAGPDQSSQLFCPTPLTFAPDSQTVLKSGLPWTGHVIYKVAKTRTYPTTVEVTDDAAQHRVYSFSSKDLMKSDDPAGCAYRRQ